MQVGDCNEARERRITQDQIHNRVSINGEQVPDLLTEDDSSDALTLVGNPGCSMVNLVVKAKKTDNDLLFMVICVLDDGSEYLRWYRETIEAPSINNAILKGASRAIQEAKSRNLLHLCFFTNR